MKHFAASILFLLIIQLNAQKTKIKYGKVSVDELKLTDCSFSPEAGSMILGTVGSIRFNYHNGKGWQYIFEHTVRKKIFDLTDKDAGNIGIVVYEPIKGINKEVLSSLKATTYNLVDGKIKKTKLPNSEEFETRLNDYRKEVSFALPDIQEGSVIEYTYIITSDYITNLRTWHFQNDIPTKYSQFTYTIPEFFRYQSSQAGNYMVLDVNKHAQSESFTYTYTTLPGAGGKTTSGTGTLTSMSTKTSLIGINIPPIEDEPFMNNKPDVPTRIEFQLASIQMPNSIIQNVASNYEAFNKEIMSWSTFGEALNKGGFSKDFIETLANQKESDKAYNIYNWISSNFSWNDVYSVSSDAVGRQAFKEKSGSIATINLTLIAALRQAGIKANPVILSTRGSGIPHPVYPNIQDFNYVIAAVQLPSGFYLVDAASKLPFGTLPERCLNGKGWLASDNGGRWVNLKNGSSSISTMTEISIGEEEIKTAYNIRQEGYAALASLGNFTNKGLDAYKGELIENFDEGYLENFNFSDSNSSKMVEMSFDIIEDFDDNDMIYINPVGYGAQLKNPFKREQRYSQIDFPYAFSQLAMMKINIPEGYEAILPDPTIVRLEDNGGSFKYSVSNMDGVITIFSEMDIKQTDFSPSSYQGLKQFYQIVSDKNNETVVLKRK